MVLAAAACSSSYGADERDTSDAGATVAPTPTPTPETDAGSSPALAGCELPWGGTIAHGESVTAYETGTRTVAEGPCKGETRLCFAGTLSGSFEFENCVAEPITTPLAESTKTLGDCLAIGGQIADAGGAYVCRRTGSSCWNGWSRYKRWSATSSKFCSGTCANPVSCTTGSHAWADKAAETCGYTEAGIKAIYCNTISCVANTVAVGCN